MNFTSPRLPGSAAARETQWPRWPALVTSLLMLEPVGEDMEQPRSFDHFDEANLDEEAKVRTPKLIKQLLAADSSSICPNVVVCCLFVVIKLKN